MSEFGNADLPNKFASYVRRILKAEDPSVAIATKTPQEFKRSTTVGITQSSVTKWNLRRNRSDLNLRFSGSYRDDAGPERSHPIHIYDPWDIDQCPAKPVTYDILAIITSFNESDVIGGLLEYLASQGVRSHVIDNWSTDETFAIVSDLADRLPITVERFPKEGPTDRYNWEGLLERVEEIAETSHADWVIHHDADEIRQSPWLGVSLSDAFWAVEQWGFNCVDHTVLNFRPTNNDWEQGGNLIADFQWCEFGDRPGHFVQLKAWKPQRERVSLASSGGHEALFPNRRVFPYKFMLRHYPIRSQSHGEKKVLRERQLRWNPEERAKSWHTHYDHYDQTSSFVWQEANLLRFDDIGESYLIQRLSGVGLPGNPNPGES